MTSAITIQASTTAFHRQNTVNVAGNLSLTSVSTKSLCLPPRRFTVTSFQASDNEASTSSEPLISSHFTSSVGSPSLQLPFSQHHFTVFNVATSAVAISATCLFCSAIPTLLAFKRAAESLEKLLDVTREELPDTMAAVRLSGIEISDLTTELTDLGQELTQGVKSSMNAVRMTEERLRRLANMTPRAPIQEIINTKAATAEPSVARTARGIREGIVKGRGMLAMIFGLTRSLTSIINYFSKRSRQALNK